ncbi:hypothetical protein, partial [Pseudomonas aeruginosa]|uniref:hypothetical protein n=1 Tax=Pseudomonas aeruginosa TaxID=287 RepID=UPI001D0AB997
VVQMLQNHAHGTFTDFRGVGRSLFHGLIFSRVEASTKPGAIHTVPALYIELVEDEVARYPFTYDEIESVMDSKIREVLFPRYERYHDT